MRCDRLFVDIGWLKKAMKRVGLKGMPANAPDRKKWAVADKGRPW